MSWNYTPEQMASIAKLRGAVNKLTDILNDNETGDVISYEQKNTLFQIKERSKKILDKLDSQNFTVAIVGLENAGKSSFANALMGIYNLLPTENIRCTYTITEIRWGQQNRGAVSFYTEAEFDEKFVALVKQISNINGTVHFRTADLGKILDRNVLKPNADKNIQADITNILNNRNNIAPLLTGNTEQFNESQLTTDYFRKYITGKAGSGDFEGYPYAVKKITIWSTRFEKMENILLYDAPGYDSTTQSHKIQSEDITKEADAVILVVSILEGAEIKSTQTAIFGKNNNGRDSYGTKFEDKTLIFGNKADLLLTDVNVNPKKVIDKLRTSARDSNIAKPEYIFLGSVRRYENGEAGNEYAGGNERESALLSEELNLPQEISGKGVCGVDLLFEKLNYYYQHVRADVLIKSVKNILGEMEESIKNLNTEYNAVEADDGGRLYIDATINLYEFKYFSSDDIQSEIDNIRESKPFSNPLKEKLKTNEDIFPNQSKSSEALRLVKRGMRLNTTGIYPVPEIDSKFRNSIYNIFLGNIKNAVDAEITKKKLDIYKLLKDKFLEIMGMTEDSPKDEKVREKLFQSVNELFNKLWNEKNEDKTDSLGIGDFDLLLQALILYPFKSKQRLGYVINNLAAFESLATYYAADSETGGQTEFFMKILAQQDAQGTQSSSANTAANKRKSVEQALQEFFSTIAYPGFMQPLDFRKMPSDRWAKELTTHGIYAVPSDLKKKIESLAKRGGIANDEKINLIDTEIKNYAAQNPVVPTSEPTTANIDESTIEINEEWLKKISNLKAGSMVTEDEMLAVLNNDIENLRYFARGALVESINIERDFISVVAHNADIIRFGMENEHRREFFKEWVADNLKLIKAAEFKSIDAAKLANLKRKRFAQDVETILKTLQN